MTILELADEAERLAKAHDKFLVKDTEAWAHFAMIHRHKIAAALRAASAVCVEHHQPVAWLVPSDETGFCRIWWRDKERAEAWLAKHPDCTVVPLYMRVQSQAKEPEASGGLCAIAPHAVQVGEAGADQPATSEHMDVTGRRDGHLTSPQAPPHDALVQRWRIEARRFEEAADQDGLGDEEACLNKYVGERLRQCAAELEALSLSRPHGEGK